MGYFSTAVIIKYLPQNRPTGRPQKENLLSYSLKVQKPDISMSGELVLFDGHKEKAIPTSGDLRAIFAVYFIVINKSSVSAFILWNLTCVLSVSNFLLFIRTFIILD